MIEAADSSDESIERIPEEKLIFADSEDALWRIFRLLIDIMGVDFSHYKRGTVGRRILRQMQLLDLQNLDDYARYLQEHLDDVENLYHDLLINVTSFFREPESFDCLQSLVFPAIFQDRSSIRIWVAGCATGQEAYSIAISLLEFFDDRRLKKNIQIFATDVSELAIAKARLGIYSQDEMSGISPERLRRFFTPVEGGYQIGKAVRELCMFARHDVTRDPPFSRLDLISCRNLLIYFAPSLQNKVMPIFHYALNPHGFLMLGSSEGIGNVTDLFAIADKKYRIYSRKARSHRIIFNFDRSSYVDDLMVADVTVDKVVVNESVDLVNSREAVAEINTELNIEQIADRVVLHRYAPVGVLVSDDLDIVQFRGDTSRYLAHFSGKPSLNVLKMAHPKLLAALRSTIHEAKQHNIPICTEGVAMSQDVRINIDVIPLQDNCDRYFLVLFASNSPSAAIPIISLAPTKSRKVRQIEAELAVIRLTHELENSKEHLRSVIEINEGINQDLKVTSEEYLSSNEELQSANEELETSKEEIQSTNEELRIVNDELRNRNSQLNQVNDDLQNLLNSVHIPILMLSDDMKIRHFTPMAEQLFNLIPSDVGRPFSHFHLNINISLTELIQSVVDTLIPCEQDVQDRSGAWYSIRIRPYRTNDNRIDGAVISLIDINALKQNTLALQASRDYVNAILQTLHQPLLVLNADLQVITANLAFHQFFQLSASQTDQRSLFEIGQGEWDIPKLRSLLNEILTEDISVQNYEITQHDPSVGTRIMLLNACQIHQANDRINGGKLILIAIEDITEREIQKQELIIKNEELSKAIVASTAASQAKSKFLGNMSHELRTPLNAIMGFSQILQSNPNLDSKSQVQISTIYQSGEYLLSLIEDLLDISKIEADKIAIAPHLISLAKFLETTINLVQNKATNKNLTLITQFAPDLPEMIYADEKCLRQVLLNLLSNAIKFTNLGSVTFTVTKSLSTSQTELIRFAIADTGVGIAAADLEKIFLPFEQVGAAAIKSEGTGLGLAISQDLVKMMGGEINAISIPNVGSTFSFELDVIPHQDIFPVTPKISSQPETTDIAINNVIDNEILRSANLPLSILIAEDVEVNRTLLDLFLKCLGYEADLAINGLEVLDRLREKHYDVILMDIQMPEMSGLEAMQKIIEEWNEPDRPYVIAVTANASPEDGKKYLAAGMNAFIGKPIDFVQLEQALLQVRERLI